MEMLQYLTEILLYNRVIDIVIRSRKPDSVESPSDKTSAKHEFDPSVTRANPASHS